MDEATQFSERAFNFLGGCLRGVNDFPKRFYITCNPGGIGHAWVKRLFIDKKYRSDPDNPEATENPDDYLFIPATVDDNKFDLGNLESLKAAMTDSIKQMPTQEKEDMQCIPNAGYKIIYTFVGKKSASIVSFIFTVEELQELLY